MVEIPAGTLQQVASIATQKMQRPPISAYIIALILYIVAIVAGVVWWDTLMAGTAIWSIILGIIFIVVTILFFFPFTMFLNSYKKRILKIMNLACIIVMIACVVMSPGFSITALITQVLTTVQSVTGIDLTSAIASVSQLFGQIGDAQNILQNQ